MLFVIALKLYVKIILKKSFVIKLNDSHTILISQLNAEFLNLGFDHGIIHGLFDQFGIK